MGIRMASALPIRPGKTDRVRSFAEEVGAHQEEFERLNEAGTFTRISIYLQEGPDGDVAVYVYEMDDPTKAGRAFTDSPFDRWWVEYYKDVHGIDLDRIPVEQNVPPPMVYEWNA